MLAEEQTDGHPALTDPVTGLGNRLHFQQVLPYMFYGADRGVALTLLMIDIRPDSEDVLSSVGPLLRQGTRASDLVSHLGNGRFGILLTGTNLPGGRVAADRLQEALEATLGDRPSLALVSYDTDMNGPRRLLEAADHALERVRSRGGGLEMISR